MGIFNKSRPEVLLSGLSGTDAGFPVLTEGIIARDNHGTETLGKVVEMRDRNGNFTGHEPSPIAIHHLYQCARMAGEITGAELVLVELHRNTEAYHELLASDGMEDLKHLARMDGLIDG